jgi:DNA-binding protein Fis
LYIQIVVERVKGVRERARRILDIDRKTLYKKLDQYEALASASTSLSN